MDVVFGFSEEEEEVEEAEEEEEVGGTMKLDEEDKGANIDQGGGKEVSTL